ncbi:MAG: hypothetical protein QOH93_1007 [Chloroflexia bacterium]|jgi:hypothetical protein|nr:hypothetical protein [Chloroflexia bacterium]
MMESQKPKLNEESFRDELHRRVPVYLGSLAGQLFAYVLLSLSTILLSLRGWERSLLSMFIALVVFDVLYWIGHTIILRTVGFRDGVGKLATNGTAS